MNRRRGFLFLLAAFVLAPRTLRAQPKQPVLIGWLSLGSTQSRTHWLAAFKEGLAEHGWNQKRQFVIEERSADARLERLGPLAQELAAKTPAVIVASGLRAAVELAKVAPKIPLVVVGGDPVAAGLAASFGRPGGMVTGVTHISTDVSEKYLELLLATAPKLRRVGFLGYPINPNQAMYLENARRSAARHSIEPLFRDVVKPEDIGSAISQLAAEGAQALVVLPGALLSTERRRIVRLSLAQRWPLIAGNEEFAEEGALLTYGADTPHIYRRAAYLVDRILRGTKPADLPIEQPTKFELVVNLKTAKALGLVLPQSFLMRADRVIE